MNSAPVFGSAATGPMLWAVILLVLVLPFVSRRVEQNMELFLFAAGSLATTISKLWSRNLVEEVLRQPTRISIVVLAVGMGFHFGRGLLDRGFRAITKSLPTRLVLFLLVFVLGILSSVLTAIIASLILVEAIHLLRLNRKQELRITVLACYSIGLGAVLTPVGEPLSTIVIAKLGEDFWFLSRVLGGYVAPGILIVSLAAAFLHPRSGTDKLFDVNRRETPLDISMRAFRIYAFVAALVLLGTGLSPLVDRYIKHLPSPLLFWVNTISSILDNATLAAAETGPVLTTDQLTAILLGLLVSGGMLIPGNVPNIIAANHLRIRSGEWARFAIPVGLVLLIGYFCAWLMLR